MRVFGFILIHLLYNFISVEGRTVYAANTVNNAHILSRHRRYLGSGSKYKLNKKYQQCVAPGDLQGHCKHAIFCSYNIFKNSIDQLDYLCVIEGTHVGVCCPDDELLSKIQGSQVLMELPASGLDYDDNDKNTGCGLRTMATPSKFDSPVKKWPWIAALYMKDSPYEQFCGGTLITDRHVLTASHCLDKLNPKDIRVRLGEYDFTKLSETRSKDFSLSDLIMHEDYNSNTYENDIAIVKLDKAANFNSYMWPICLPPVNRSFENEKAFVAGWGRIFYKGPTSELLLEVSIPVWEIQKCIDAFAQRITDNFLCAAAYEGGQDSCQGDSGGPLLYQLENGRWVIIGVVSWGIGCGDKGKPGIYTRVNNYIPWILKYTLSD